jgi:Tfp pilus assembly protein PilO
MKLTSREKVLVGVLLLGIFVFIMYNYMITPTINDIETLEVTKQEKELELSQMKGVISREQEYIDAYDLYNRELFELSKDFYIDLKQEDMLVLLNNLNKSENLQIDNFAFSDNSNKDNAKNQMIVRFDYTGPYQEVYSYLDNISQNDKYIQVSNLDINSSASLIVLSGPR